MVEPIFFTLTLLAALGCGLVAGLMFIFSNTVMKALGVLQPAQGVAAMQAINRVILNPLFFLVFMGTAVNCVVLMISLFWRWQAPGAIYLLAGSVLYLLGCILVTFLFNVPMNNSLDAVKPEEKQTIVLWANYLAKWTAWNHVRTIAAFLATMFFILSFS